MAVWNIAEMLGGALGLLLLILMAAAPLLVELNDRFPARRSTSPVRAQAPAVSPVRPAPALKVYRPSMR